MKSRVLTVGSTVLLVSVLAGQANGGGIAESFGGRVLDSTTRQVDRRIDQHIDNTVEKAITTTEEAIYCTATDRACLEQAKREGRKVEVVDRNDPYTVRCSVRDTKCLQRAKAAGRTVELTD